MMCRSTALLVLAALLSVTCPLHADEPNLAPGASLLRLPLAPPRNESTPALGWWTGVGTGRGTHRFVVEDGEVIAYQTSEGVARLQYGTSSLLGDALKPYWGKIVEVSAEVRGQVDLLGPEGAGAVLVVDFSSVGNVAGMRFELAPRTKMVKGRSVAEKTSGPLEWTTLRSTFRVPENTEKIALLMYLMNSQGTLQWRRVKLQVAPEGTTPEQTLAPFPTVEEARATIALKTRAAYDKRLGELRQKLSIPEPAKLYEVPSDLGARRPRLFFDERTTPAVLRQRGSDPRFAEHVQRIRAMADALIAYREQLPATARLDVEDPLRGWADGLALQAAAAVSADTPELRARYVDAVAQWTRKLMSYGKTGKNLPLAQYQVAFAVSYDWLYADLPEDLRRDMRRYMLDLARASFDFASNEVNWVFATQYLANHNWFNYMGRTITALCLWGEPEVDEAELRGWLDASVENYFVVSKTHSKLGLPVEGFLYGDYGTRPYLDFATRASALLNLKFDLVHDDALRNMSARVFASLPGHRGYMVYCDSKAAQFSGWYQFRWLARQFQDARAQLLADLMVQRVQQDPDFIKGLTTSSRFTDVNSWRALFWTDPDLAPAKLADLPRHYDDTDLGLYLARTGWDGSEAFFGLRCGPSAGKTTADTFGPKWGTGHAYPEQGNFVLHHGTLDILPGCDYARIKVTTNHNLVVFEGRDAQKGSWVGQVGEGGQWFDTGRNRNHQAQRHAQVLQVQHAADYHQYLCDLGGLYLLADDRAAGKQMFPTYVRSLTFLASGAVVVIDRVAVEHPRVFKLRLLTVGTNLTLMGDDVQFNLSGGRGIVRTFPTAGITVETSQEELLTWGENHRGVVSMTSAEATAADFVAVVGKAEAVQPVRVTRDGSGYAIDHGGQIIRVTLP